MTKPTFALWKAFWLYAIPICLTYQLLWGQVFSYWASNEWFIQGYQTLLISKHASEILVYSVVVYLLVKHTSSDSWLAIVMSRGFFLVLLLLTTKAFLIDIELIS